MHSTTRSFLRTLAVLAAAPCPAFAASAALHLPGLATGLSSGTGTLALLLQWLFGG